MDRFLSNIKQKMLGNSSLTTRNSHGLRLNYCFFLQIRETETSVRGIPALLIGVINAVFSLVAVAENALILAAIRRKSSLRTPFYIFLAGLAATDLAKGLITQPMYATYTIVKFNQPDLFPCIAITIYHTFDRYLSALTIGIITAMAIEKWIHLRHPFLITTRRIYVICVVLLVIPALFTGARIWLISVRDFREVWMPVLRGIVGGLCLLALLFSYLKVFKTIHRHQLQIQASQSRQSTAQSTVNLAKYKKSVYTVLFIVALFLLCYVPSIICMSVVVLLNWFDEPFSVVYHALFTLFYVSSSINPVLYYSRIKEIRVEVKLLLKKIVCKG